MGDDGFASRLWEQTPWWHPRAWAGYRMRRWVWDAWSYSGEYDGNWEYQTIRQRARAALEEQYGREQPSSDEPTSDGGRA